MPIIENDRHYIGDLFNNRNPFVIPLHQRSYSWEKEEVESFCDDIAEISIDQNAEYFFGGVVSVFEHAQNGPGRIYRIVDGQQRMSTFMLFFHNIRRGLSEVMDRPDISAADQNLARENFDQIWSKYMTYRDTRRRPAVDIDRLVLSRIDKEFFNRLINGNPIDGSKVSHERISKANETIYRKLIKPILDRGTSNEDQIYSLIDLSSKLLDRSILIHIVTDNLDEAYQLFEVLNDRGKDLAIGDYLRSSTLSLITGDEEALDNVTNNWDCILGVGYADKFLKNYLGSNIGKVKTTNVHRQFRNVFFSDIEPGRVVAEISDRTRNMADMLGIYSKLTEGIWPYNQSGLSQWKRERLMDLIKRLKHTQAIPFLMAVYEEESEEVFYSCVIGLCKFAFRYIRLCGLRVSRLTAIYQTEILKLRGRHEDGLTFDYSIFKLQLNRLIDQYASDEKVAVEFENLLYSDKTRDTLRYLLCILDYHFVPYRRGYRDAKLIPNENHNHLIDTLDIEHIYAQNHGYDQGLNNDLNKIGNLTFWGDADNRSNRDALFNAKKDSYLDSSVKMTQSVGELDEWTHTLFKERHDMMLDMIKCIFYLY